jgi:hypothetical protein
MVGAVIIGVANATAGKISTLEPIYIFLIWFGISFIIILGIIRWQESRLKKHLGLTQERWNKLREERMKHRQIYANRVNIPKMLLELQEYTISEVSKQQVTHEEAVAISKELFRETNKLALLPALIWYVMPLSLQRRIKMQVFFAQALLNWSAILKRHNLGTMVVVEQKAYQDLNQQIANCKVGLPAKTTAKIDGCIIMSDLLSSTVLFTTSRDFEEMLQSLGRVRNTLPYLVKGIDMGAGKLRSQVSEEIEKFLLGE